MTNEGNDEDGNELAVELAGLWPVPYVLSSRLSESQQREDTFTDAAVELTKEFGTLAHLLAGLVGAEPPDRNGAILRGMAVRISKLTLRLVAETCEMLGEMQGALDRMILETTADMSYLVVGPDERFDAYVKDSMVPDRVLWDTIARNVEARGGEVQPIENRMRRSLESKFKLAGLDPVDIGRRSANGWPSVEERMTSLWGSRTYLGYRAGSHAIHGSWNELVTHHLDAGARFEPKLDWSVPRPQPLFQTVIVTGSVLIQLAERLGDSALAEFEPRLNSVVMWAVEADRLHEAFLTARS